VKGILFVSLVLLMPPAHAASLVGDSANGQALVRRQLHGMPRYECFDAQGPSRSVLGRFERAVGRLQSYGQRRILRKRNAGSPKYLNDQFYRFR
jgi:hypothetical protein